MRDVIQSNKFKKDLKRCKSRGYDLDKFGDIAELIRRDEPLAVERSERANPPQTNKPCVLGRIK